MMSTPHELTATSIAAAHAAVALLLSDDGAQAEAASIAAEVVAGPRATEFVPSHFGAERALAGELAIFKWMETLCRDQIAGCWEYVELSNGGFYLRPTGNAIEPRPLNKALMPLACGNGFAATVSRDAAGIVATLYALNGLVWGGADELDAAYCALREYALEHPEHAAITRAIG